MGYGGEGEGCELRSGCKPGGEVGLEGELVRVAEVVGFAGLFDHYAVLEEEGGSVKEAVYAGLP